MLTKFAYFSNIHDRTMYLDATLNCAYVNHTESVRTTAMLVLLAVTLVNVNSRWPCFKFKTSNKTACWFMSY
jgi:hypothetical protein